eukprot:NODE_309_length_11266_cov_0.459479.p9 type:complete len:131 gc:universal NODE_309_length_11266_cov_0.459479:4903-5295(+)
MRDDNNMVTIVPQWSGSHKVNGFFFIHIVYTLFKGIFAPERCSSISSSCIASSSEKSRINATRNCDQPNRKQDESPAYEHLALQIMCTGLRGLHLFLGLNDHDEVEYVQNSNRIETNASKQYLNTLLFNF